MTWAGSFLTVQDGWRATHLSPWQGLRYAFTHRGPKSIPYSFSSIVQTEISIKSTIARLCPWCMNDRYTTQEKESLFETASRCTIMNWGSAKFWHPSDGGFILFLPFPSNKSTKPCKIASLEHRCTYEHTYISVKTGLVLFGNWCFSRLCAAELAARFVWESR